MEDQRNISQLDAESDAAITDSEVEALFTYFDCIEQEYFQTLESSQHLCHEHPGLLRYKRESQEKTYSPQPQSLKNSPVCCQFCGLKAWPPLDMVYAEMQEGFCCDKYKELFDFVVDEKQMAVKHFEGRPSGPAAQLDGLFTNEDDELQVKGLERGKNRHQQREVGKYDRDHNSKFMAAKNNITPVPHTKTVISFQLSNCAPKENVWSVEDCTHKQRSSGHWANNEPSTLGSFEFGLTHHENSSRFLEKNYSNGTKFLTVLPDGSSQVFYPSGNLAIIIIKSEMESVCIIHDDIVSPVCPVRALFQSDGRATCYHGNGFIWLSMDVWGGQSLDERGRKVRTWSWTDHDQTLTFLRPIFMSLNRNIGVRVLGQQSVFVSFLALGQQARFRVGSSSTKHIAPPQPFMCKEELMLLACRIALYMALTRMQQCQAFPASSTHLQVRPPPFLHSLVRRLRSLGHTVQMDETEKTFIKRCLQSCA
ncbi:glutamate-rich protein 6 isoform X4 [Triplophysa dalaica]|uniref:glutamate-rich protein 6 isoform X4 n=1 Tax=Triplophysa dalaica TaxID=1582913 RepID=UPI0024DFB846|nr:glutamate-rich protein 6 isoform X4 [Triplophysa dalaica]